MDEQDLNCSLSLLDCPAGLTHRPVPLEAVGFLGAVAVFLLLLLVFALYLNKAFCFANCGGFPCIDQMPKKDANSLGAAFQYSEDTSSDSDDEVLKHYQGLKSTGSVRGSVRSARSARSARTNRSAHSARSAKTDSSKRASQGSGAAGAA